MVFGGQRGDDRELTRQMEETKQQKGDWVVESSK